MDSSNRSRSPLCALYAIMGANGRKKYLNFISRKIKRSSIIFQKDLNQVASILFILLQTN